MTRFLLVIALALLTACSAPASEAPATDPTSTSAAPPVEVLPPLDPDSIEITRIGVQSTLIGLGTDPDGTWTEPDVNTPEQASWYTGGPVPGSRGPATILGHVNGGGRPGVFVRLNQLQVGDNIMIRGKDGRSVRFAVVRVQHALKTEFPVGEVFAPVPDAQLRLISCGGQLDTDAHRYLGSIVVYAVAQL